MLCKYCGEDKPEQKFEIAATVKGKTYRRKKCNTCKLKDKTLRRNRTKKWYNELKQELSCKYCGISDFRCLEFHHLNPTEKDRNISEMLNWGVQAILIEINKCEVICANCHRILHYNERNGD